MIQEKSYLCFYLYHTTCRNRILAEKTTRKMERERYCELIWCLWIGLIFRNNVHLQPWVDWKIFTTQLAGTEFSRRRHRGRWRERGIVHWFGACELVWYLEIICIFSHESIEKSLPHNLQEPNSRGDVNAEDGEVIVDSKSFSTQNAQVGYWLIGAQKPWRHTLPRVTDSFPVLWWQNLFLKYMSKAPNLAQLFHQLRGNLFV